MFAGPSISQNGIAEVKVYADSLIGSRRTGVRYRKHSVCSDSLMLSDKGRRRYDKQRPIATDGRSCIPKCMAPGCIDKPIAGCDVTAIDGPRVAGIVAMIIMTLVTFVITGAGHRIVISSVHEAGLPSMNIRPTSFQRNTLYLDSIESNTIKKKN